MVFDKYLFLNIDKYKVSYSQSKTTGQLFFDLGISAGSRKELKSESEEAIKICTDVCNNFNKHFSRDNDKSKQLKKVKELK